MTDEVNKPDARNQIDLEKVIKGYSLVIDRLGAHMC
jgi:hypothetical protein